jgi:hypothetical protein
MTHVAIAIPSTGVHETNMSMRLAQLVANSTGHISPLSLMSVEHAAIANSRNVLAGWGVECGADYVFWLDSDIGVPHDALLRLAKQAEERGMDILGCVYAQRQPPHEVHGMPIDRSEPFHESLRIGGLKEFEWLPGGCMLVSTKVYKKLPKPWYFESYGYDGSVEIQLVQAMRDAFHAELPDEVLYRAARLLEPSAKNAGRLTIDRSEDTNFCRKARRYRFSIWADMDLSQELIHMGKNPVCIGRPRAANTPVIESVQKELKALEHAPSPA